MSFHQPFLLNYMCLDDLFRLKNLQTKQKSRKTVSIFMYLYFTLNIFILIFIYPLTKNLTFYFKLLMAELRLVTRPLLHQKS